MKIDQAIIEAALFAAVTSHLMSVAGNNPDHPWIINPLNMSW